MFTYLWYAINASFCLVFVYLSYRWSFHFSVDYALLVISVSALGMLLAVFFFVRSALVLFGKLFWLQCIEYGIWKIELQLFLFF